jgi:hypothetical protein
MRKTWAGVAAAAALFALAGTARAGLEPGEVAPAYEGKDYINTPEVGLKQLRGHVILYEIFRTW